MIDFTEILTKAITGIKERVIASMQQNKSVATGKTIANMDVVVSTENAQLWAPLSIDALEYGRSPTRVDAPAGNPTVYQCIVEWAQAKGIDEFGTNKMGETVNVWRAITASIHKEGYEGTPGVITGPLSDDNMSEFLDPACNAMADQVGNEVLGLFDILTQ